MDKKIKLSLFFLRISLGWILLYAGVTKLLDPSWSAAGYLNNAQTFSGLYAWLASDQLLPIVNILNEWGLTLIGLSLVLGAFTRISSLAGALLMLLYYFPALNFPIANSHYYLIDYHIIFIIDLILLHFTEAGDFLVLDRMIKKISTNKN